MQVTQFSMHGPRRTETVLVSRFPCTNLHSKPFSTAIVIMACMSRPHCAGTETFIHVQGMNASCSREWLLASMQQLQSP